MKTHFIKICLKLSIIIFLNLVGCATVEETLYLREAEIAGPLTTAPIHITDTTNIPSITISPTFSYNTQKTFTGSIAEFTTIYALDSTFVPSDNSLTWNVATVNAGINLDVKLFRGFALTLGVNYSGQQNFDAWGGNLGIGFFSYSKGTAFRMDAGLQIHSMQYDAYTVSKVVVNNVFGSDETYISYYHDIGESTHFDPYVTLTFNTAFRTWPVNIFINGGYVVQTLFSFTPESSYYYYPTYHKTDNRGSKTAGFVAFTPGIYFNVTEVTRVVAGCSFYFETQINDANPSLFILPMMQVDFTF